jgi:NADH:ubiquinone oxidoreductase subunit B-like Fe-S oxidoreductase
MIELAKNMAIPAFCASLLGCGASGGTFALMTVTVVKAMAIPIEPLMIYGLRQHQDL